MLEYYDTVCFEYISLSM